jgi:cytochrome c-type biogenesis protein CcmH
MRALMLGIAITLGSTLAAQAVQPDEMLADPALETRARTLSAELRCVVCQNQSIDDSDAALARDLRLIVRERLVAGDSNEAVLDYVVARYGEFVLLRPRLGLHTVLLWSAPVLVLLGGALVLLRNRRSSGNAVRALTSEEEARLKAILRRD